ncbi:MAG: hypothetical protein ACPGWS_07810 [Solirubrobacterales bacterium]
MAEITNVTGPHPERGKFRIRWVEDGAGTSKTFANRELAEAAIAHLRGDKPVKKRSASRAKAPKGTASWWQTKLANAAERVERSITDEALAARTLATLAGAAGKFVDVDKLQRRIEQLEQIAEKAEKAMDKGRVH